MGEDEREAGGLKRAITPTLLLIFIVGDVLGGGIYALVGEVGAETGGAIWSAFVLALIMAVFTAGSYAELVSKYPHAGGAALYGHHDDLRVVDWAGLVSANRGWLAGDGVHVNATGYQARARAIAKQVERC